MGLGQDLWDGVGMGTRSAGMGWDSVVGLGGDGDKQLSPCSSLV